MDKAAENIANLMTDMGSAARNAMFALGQSSNESRNRALHAAARAIRDAAGDILSANEKDCAGAASRGVSAALMDRLQLNKERVEGMARGLEAIAALPDPLRRVQSESQRPNGLLIQRVSVPLGVIGIVYESRPNVTADAAALCIKSGNTALLRGGSESFHSNTIIHRCLSTGLLAAGLNAATVQYVPTTDRAAVGFMLAEMSEWIDVVVPRGGKSLIERVQRDARVPVIGHLEGLCHMYLHQAADAAMATELVLNAKMRRTGICGALETLLVDRDAATRLLPAVCDALQASGCEIRGDSAVRAIWPGAVAASEADWTTEYLDAVLAIRVVDNIDAAIGHIQAFGSGHTESIVTEDSLAAEHFLGTVDSAIVMHNSSTQFADGGEFGMGAEIGIATGRVHARGPVGTEQLTSYKYVVRGSGQVRPA